MWAETMTWLFKANFLINNDYSIASVRKTVAEQRYVIIFRITVRLAGLRLRDQSFWQTTNWEISKWLMLVCVSIQFRAEIELEMKGRHWILFLVFSTFFRRFAVWISFGSTFDRRPTRNSHRKHLFKAHEPNEYELLLLIFPPYRPSGGRGNRNCGWASVGVLSSARVCVWLSVCVCMAGYELWFMTRSVMTQRIQYSKYSFSEQQIGALNLQSGRWRNDHFNEIPSNFVTFPPSKLDRAINVAFNTNNKTSECTRPTDNDSFKCIQFSLVFDQSDRTVNLWHWKRLKLRKIHANASRTKQNWISFFVQSQNKTVSKFIHRRHLTPPRR